MEKPKDIVIVKGSTFSLEARWEKTNIVRKAIAAISFATGAPRLTVTSHGIPDGWRAAVTMVAAPKQINAQNSPPKDSDYHKVTVVDVNTIEFNAMTPVDEAGRNWAAYTSGGFVQYYEPQDLTGYTARMDMRNKIGGTLLLSSEAADAPLDKIVLSVDTSGKKITMAILPTDTAALTFRTAVTDLEMVSSLGVVTKLKLTSTGAAEDPDPVRVTGEVTT